MSEFFSMGGYAAYVWGSYGLALIVLVGILVASVRYLRSTETMLKALEQARPQRRRARGAGALPLTAGEAAGEGGAA
ncbi:heme exporter protein CcmD [Rhodospirillum centenum]|uniref:Heme exporter protein D n=1 Tax=Rhodospirillum centenum (strain ATCC 51521 / SW) TaxID=414684 RepID=B6IVR0_RHOCS|nr:heme exporter protein CcmD [Rhodospirillum centenum]ACJ00384.1 cytochrome c-type biogenesis protein CcmD [Rhodospirillum centenum SW]